MLLHVALLAVLAADPLAAAKKHLAARQADQVVLDLADDVTLDGAQAVQAAAVLTQAAQAELDAKDPVLALQLAQMARRRDGTNVNALQVLIALAMADQRYGEAEGYADQWKKVAPADARAALARVRIGAAQGDWDLVAANAPSLSKNARLSAAERAEAAALAKKSAANAAAGENTSDALEARLREAADAAARDREAAFTAQKPQAEAQVVIYGTSWCGYCKKARAFFTQRGIPFEDKDIEQDHDASRELMQKARASGIHPTGVPVIDVRGTLVEGFDVPKIESLLGS